MALIIFLLFLFFILPVMWKLCKGFLYFCAIVLVLGMMWIPFYVIFN